MNRVTRSEKHKVIGGVAGGLAEYFDIDPLIPRILFIIALFWNGGGVLVYIILWIILPVEQSTLQSNPSQDETTGPLENATSGAPIRQENAEENNSSNFPQSKTTFRTNIIAGLILIFIGILILMDQILPVFYFEYFWPLVLIIVGGSLLASGLK